MFAEEAGDMQKQVSEKAVREDVVPEDVQPAISVPDEGPVAAPPKPKYRFLRSFGWFQI